MSENRAAPGAITHVWGLTESQWLQRVQSAEARADALEAENERLREALAYEARVAEAHYEGYKTYPKTRRPFAEAQVVRMRQLAVGGWPKHYLRETAAIYRELRTLRKHAR